jgi:hypothetical protein
MRKVEHFDLLSFKMLTNCEARPHSLQTRIRDIRTYVLAEMRNVREVLNADAARVRAKLASHIEKITLKPSGECYLASGTWDFVGRGSIDGAGGRICTILPSANFFAEIAA